MVTLIHVDQIRKDRDNDLVIHFRMLDATLEQPVGETLISSPVQMVELVHDAKGIAGDGSRVALLIHTQRGSRYLSSVPHSELATFGSTLEKETTQ